jgi:hypothetical protein
MAVAAPGRRAHGDEDRIRPVDGAARSVVKRSRPAATLRAMTSIEAGLVDRHLAALEPGDLLGRLVDADHVMAEIRKAHPGDEPDIARADHRDLHVTFEIWLLPGR